MIAQSAQTCQKCHSVITPEQIAAKQAGTVRGIWLCPPCVEALKQQVATSHSGLLDNHKSPVPAVSPPQPAVSIPTAETSNFALTPAPESPSGALAGSADSVSPRVEGGSAIRTLASRGGVTAHDEMKFHRALAPPDQHPTRIRTFHARMSGSALQNLDQAVNEWLDAHPEVFIKNVTATVGVFEAKISTEEHLVLTIFY